MALVQAIDTTYMQGKRYFVNMPKWIGFNRFVVGQKALDWLRDQHIQPNEVTRVLEDPQRGEGSYIIENFAYTDAINN